MSHRRTTLVAAVLALLSLATLSGRKWLNVAGVPEAPRDELSVEEVSFQHGDHTLWGSFYRPRGTGPYPAVVMILGSDDHDRDYGGVGPALGRHFGRAGIACLSWDKPGVGKSTGDYNTQTFRDRAEETLAAVQFLRGREDIRQDRIGLWGHSQGGMVAPLAASLSGDVAFLIEVSGWQGPVWQQDPARVGAELRASGSPEAEVEQAVAFARKRMDMIRGTGPYQELDEAQNAVKTLPWFRSVKYCDRTLFEAARRNVGRDTTPWWSQVRCPVLVIYGDCDTSTGPPEPIVAIIRRGLEAAENRDVTVRIFRDADHSILRARPARGVTGGVWAQGQPKDPGPDFATGYLETMTDWVAKKVVRPAEVRAGADRRARHLAVALAGVVVVASLGVGAAIVRGLRGVKLCSAAHNAVGLAGESPVVGIDCLPT